MLASPIAAPIADKMAYFRTQHRSKGVKVTHQIGTPINAFGLPLRFAKPRLGVPTFVGGRTLEIAGHKWFAKNMPSSHKGWITYQLTGLIHILGADGEMLACRGQRKIASAAPTPPTEAITWERPARMAA